jgi:kynurenine formamidase
MTLDDVLAFVAGARVYDLGLSLETGVPHGPTHSPYLFSLVKKHGQVVYRGGASSATDVFSMGSHVGTHIDALGHASMAGKLHGGVDAESVQSFGGGLARHGADELAPLVCRGILLDVPALRGVDVCAADESITAVDLEKMCDAQDVRPAPGDAVLVRTGWIRHWPDHERYHSNPAPGLVLDAAEWLAARGARCVGSDTYAVEKVPAHGLAVHVALLVDHGIPMIEMLDLEALARARAFTFLFVAVPLKLKGATGSPLRPLALVAA